MNKQKKHPSILEVAHEMATGLYDAGIINATTMREFDSSCLPSVQNFSPMQIKRIRLRERVSQAVFARFLNTTLSTIRQWEHGDKHPRGTSLKLLNLVNKKGLKVLT